MNSKKKSVRPVSLTAGLNQYLRIKSLVGNLLLVTDGDALTGLYFAGQRHTPPESGRWTRADGHPVLRKAATQLAEYFTGKRKTFSVPLRLSGTSFQEKIWREIARIPHGATIDYTELARRAGSPNAVRAAGTSTGRNPVAILIPCHRVLGKDGSLCGFAGGLQRKRTLLALENRGR